MHSDDMGKSRCCSNSFFSFFLFREGKRALVEVGAGGGGGENIFFFFFLPHVIQIILVAQKQHGKRPDRAAPGTTRVVGWLRAPAPL